MNRAKKTKANPVKLLEVKLLLRGFASELPPEPEPEHTALLPATVTLEDMPEQLAMMLRLRRVSKASLTQMKQILKKCKQASKACRARQNAHGSKPPRLGRTAWLTQRAKLVDERAAVRKVQEKAEAEVHRAHVQYVIDDRAVQTMRADCLEGIMRMNDYEMPAWLQAHTISRV